MRAEIRSESHHLDASKTVRNLIVETDLGRDPDDFFAICYLIGCGQVAVRLITISPGDADQVAVAKFLLSQNGLDIPVGVGKRNRTKSSSGGVHRQLLARYNFPFECPHDGYGPDLIKWTHDQYPATDLFICGPLTSVGKYLRDYPDVRFERATMQGGFCGYDVHGKDVVKLAKFAGKRTVRTFNLNGDPGGGQAFLSADIVDRRFVGKHLCHTIVYDGNVHQRANAPTENRAKALFNEAMTLYLEKHPGGKKFHDPLAAVAHLRPEIFTWIRGRPYQERDKWGTVLSPDGDHIAIDVDREVFWNTILHFELSGESQSGLV